MVNSSLPGREIQVPERVVAGHQRAGWVAKDDQSPPPPPDPPSPEPPIDSASKAIPPARPAKTAKE